MKNTKEMSFLLVGDKNARNMQLINTFFNSGEFSKKEINASSCTTEIKIQERIIKLYIQSVSSKLKAYKKMTPSAFIFIYDLDNFKTFEALSKLREEVEKVFPTIFPKAKKVLIGNHLGYYSPAKDSDEKIGNFAKRIKAKSYKVNANYGKKINNIFIETVEDVLGIDKEDNIENSSESDKIHEVTMLFVGAEGVRKLEIMKAFLDSDIEYGMYGSKTVQINNKNVKFNLCDSNSNIEKLKFIPFEPDVVVLVYDANNISTYSALNDWCTMACYYFPHALLTVVGDYTYSTPENGINPRLGESYADGIYATFYQVNTETKENIEDLFKDNAGRVLDPSKVIIRRGQNIIFPTGKNEGNESGVNKSEEKQEDANNCCLII